ncbi:hypothetical protein F5887DRAFT_470058 [Amanita rubescens]|nr:hypothetical protein F5887DRAFT_470058 [Amanita rubescens]
MELMKWGTGNGGFGRGWLFFSFSSFFEDSRRSPVVTPTPTEENQLEMFESSFTDWLFLEAAKAKGAQGSDVPAEAKPSSNETDRYRSVPTEAPPHTSDSSHRTSTTARNGVYQQA